MSFIHNWVINVRRLPFLIFFCLFIYLSIYLLFSFLFFLSNLRLDHSKCIIPTIIRIIQLLKTPQLNFPCTILARHHAPLPFIRNVSSISPSFHCFCFCFLFLVGGMVLHSYNKQYTLSSMVENKCEKSGHGVATFESRGGPKRISQTLALPSHTGRAMMTNSHHLSPLPPKTTHHMICLKNCSKHCNWKCNYSCILLFIKG